MRQYYVLSQLQTTSQESHHFRKTNSPSLKAIDLPLSFFQSPTLHLPLWVVSSASEIRSLYFCSLNQKETWQNGFNGTELTELMVSTVYSPKKWLLDTDIVSWFALLPSLNLSTIAQWVFQYDSTRICSSLLFFINLGFFINKHAWTISWSILNFLGLVLQDGR